MALLNLYLLQSCSNDEFITSTETTNNVITQIPKESRMSLAEIKTVAKNFSIAMLGKSHTSNITRKIENNISKFETIEKDGTNYMYIFNFTKGGFVIVGGSKDYYPILAYSENGSFDKTNYNIGLVNWIDETSSALANSSQLPDSFKQKMKEFWDEYQDDIGTSRTALSKIIKKVPTAGQQACWDRCEELLSKYDGQGWKFAPLEYAQQDFEALGLGDYYNDLCYSAKFNHSELGSSVVGWKKVHETQTVQPLIPKHWHQGPPFNNLCDNQPAGCGAVALSQILYYYKYPQRLSFNNISFTWSEYESDTNNVAKLIKITGEYINTHYSSNFSWATPGDMLNGIKKLGYKVSEYNYDTHGVENAVFYNKQPVIMLANADDLSFLPSPLKYLGNSHYWVCHGVKRLITGRVLVFAEWQPYDKGNFVSGWHSLENPDILGGVITPYFYMNWGGKNGKINGWYLSDNTNIPSGNYKHSRKVFYISRY